MITVGPYCAVGADGGEGVGSTGEQPVPVDQQDADVVLTLLLKTQTTANISTVQ